VSERSHHPCIFKDDGYIDVIAREQSDRGNPPCGATVLPDGFVVSLDNMLQALSTTCVHAGVLAMTSVSFHSSSQPPITLR
jgi:hypothetical protein